MEKNKMGTDVGLRQSSRKKESTPPTFPYLGFT